MPRKADNDKQQLDLLPGMATAATKDSKSGRMPAQAARPAAPVQAPVPVLMTPWVRVPQPNGDVLLKAGKPVVLEDEIGTREAARILGLNQRTVERYCESGVLVEGMDWWQPPARPGSPKGGMIRIKRTSVMRLRGVEY